jgi:hypothetical protein
LMTKSASIIILRECMMILGNYILARSRLVL